MSRQVTRDTKPKTQREAVIWHLKYAGTLTAAEAMKEYGIYRLAAIIIILREECQNTTWSIETLDKKGVNRFGHTFKYARYKLHIGHVKA